MSAVEDMIEEQRFQERTGGPVSSKDSAHLFQMDIGPDVTASSTGKTTDRKPLSRKARARAKQLKSDVVVKGNTNIKPLVKASGKGREYSLEKEIKEKKADKSNAEPAKPRKVKTILDVKEGEDVWSFEEADPTNGHAYLQHLKISKPAMPDSVANPMPSSAPTVDTRAAGQSYNPLYEDHQALLAEAVDNELRKEEEAKRIKASMPKIGTKEEERLALLRELREGVDEFVRVDLDDVLAKDQEEDDAIEATGFDPVIKTKAQRLAEERNRALQAKKEEAKQRKRQAQDLERVEALANEVTKHERRQARKAEAKRQSKAKRALNPRQLSKFRHTEAEVDFKTTDELVGSLRQLQPEGNLLKDRLRSMNRRNILEYRVKTYQRRRYPIKWITNRTHKNFDLQLKIERQAAAKAEARAQKKLAQQQASNAASIAEPKSKKGKKRKVKRA
eukprot:TRINITY_DN10541_c0_g1_i2.p1 TRINITY_DN10541_c0_g1~~TRINITY_DN10541_c0_g1_i2.p1  ORF type:complete len:515 (+),score=124.74 TRINITY_DN10541_c0_g1_i2:206-1546(+)